MIAYLSTRSTGATPFPCEKLQKAQGAFSSFLSLYERSIVIPWIDDLKTSRSPPFSIIGRGHLRIYRKVGCLRDPQVRPIAVRPAPVAEWPRCRVNLPDVPLVSVWPIRTTEYTRCVVTAVFVIPGGLQYWLATSKTPTRRTHFYYVEYLIYLKRSSLYVLNRILYILVDY